MGVEALTGAIGEGEIRYAKHEEKLHAYFRRLPVLAG
jgi:hypothetical protein